MAIILASKSPRRKELLSLMGLDFKIITEDVDETINSALAVEDEVARLSRKKAQAVQVGDNDIVISADTIVVSDNTIMGKPRDFEDARRMLKLLSGNTHRVLTGVTVKQAQSTITKTVTTYVTFRTLDDGEIDKYIQSGEPMDKAGAYGIQGAAAVFVSRIEGDYFNIVGLPVCTLYEMLKQLSEG